jgi:hypothetical protein
VSPAGRGGGGGGPVVASVDPRAWLPSAGCAATLYLVHSCSFMLLPAVSGA